MYRRRRALLVLFGFLELRTASPLMDISIFRIRPFLVENLVLGISMLVFVPVFFFASEYAQISLGKSASSASLVLLYFFLGFVVAAQIGGRMLDRGGAKRPVVLGCVLAAVGFWLWSDQVTSLDFGGRSGARPRRARGWGSCSAPATTDAVNRASRLSYGEATGITQTVRNYAASLGPRPAREPDRHSRCTRGSPTSLVGQGLPRAQASLPRPLTWSLRTVGDAGRDPALRPARLRVRDPVGALRDGDHHGGGGDHRDRRVEARRPGGGEPHSRGCGRAGLNRPRTRRVNNWCQAPIYPLPRHGGRGVGLPQTELVSVRIGAGRKPAHLGHWHRVACLSAQLAARAAAPAPISSTLK